MTDSFGARLRRRREEQGIALGAIAEQTKIKASLLEALERDDVSQWPSGIFRRAFIRAYAHAIGLDPDVIVREFLEVHPEPDELAAAAALVASAADGGRPNSAPPTRLRQMVGSAFGTLGLFRRSSQAQESPASTPTPQVDRPPAVSPAVSPAAEERVHPGPSILIDETIERPDDLSLPNARELENPSAQQPPIIDLPAFDDMLREEPAFPPAPQFAPTTGPRLDASQIPAVQPSAQPVVHATTEIPAQHADDAQSPVQVRYDRRPRDSEEAQPPVSLPVEGVSRHAEPPPPAPARVELDPASFEPDFLALAHLCTAFALVEETSAMRALLEKAARVLDAAGVIVWIWDAVAEHLRPAVVHGYSERVIAQLPMVGPDDDNATAAAFRSGRPCAIGASAHTCSALALPLLTPAGCAGVLAIELPPGREQSRPVRAAATILAAMLAQLAGGAVPEPGTVTARVPPPGARPRVPQAPRLERA